MSVPQYHPAKVMDIYSGSERGVIAGDGKTQAMVKMWDGHTLVVDVEPKLRGKLRQGDIVLVDYYPSGKFQNPIPRIIITKALRGEKARKLVDEYKSYYKRTRKAKSRHKSPAEERHGRYIG